MKIFFKTARPFSPEIISVVMVHQFGATLMVPNAHHFGVLGDGKFFFCDISGINFDGNESSDGNFIIQERR